ncbi:MAG: DUF4827 domain-containing protein [Tannerellaceae bacterium]|jgi:hypothetical protein|nr:DUF4827 domain-containing protein [uncultured Macellibacteroides sp.]MBN2661924.1 DUF4827 domain-containing protein [Tannerellaceae bacterium]MBP7487384.1 DUF4827 domain-containing protein [Parabacteroides sp.]MCE5224747.1 DUF4827 domain-containing protein [Porphyromonadaceae bacterium]MBP9578749.1 DUF4827 domain-containing protein [Parabacteroides sp.]MDD3357951.1 DUF4827 domain-containing protein [Parabacteroides sp.]
MKKSFNILLILCAALTVVSCGDKTKSYTDMLNAQEKAIETFIQEKGIKVLDEYPANGVFKENEFVLLDNDVYMNVIDSGNGTRAVLSKTTVLTRFRGNLMVTDTASFENFSSWKFPVEFKYGNYGTAVDNNAFNAFLSEGLGTPLQYVGDRAKVKLIVPFQAGSTQGTYSQQSSGTAVYFDLVTYQFD